MPVPRPQCLERVLRFQDPATFTAKLSEYAIVVTLLARHGIQVRAERFVRGAPSLCACFSLRTSGMAEDACATNAWSELKGQRALNPPSNSRTNMRARRLLSDGVCPPVPVPSGGHDLAKRCSPGGLRSRRLPSTALETKSLRSRRRGFASSRGLPPRLTKSWLPAAPSWLMPRSRLPLLSKGLSLAATGMGPTPRTSL